MIIKAPASPVAKTCPITSKNHGISKIDNYHWLKAKNWHDVIRNPISLPEDIRTYLEAENAYQEAYFHDTKKLQNILINEMKSRIKQDDSSIPTKDGNFFYFSQYNEGDQYPQFVRSSIHNNKIEILFDGPKEAKAFEYFSIGLISHSPGHDKLAWSLDNNGSEFYELYIRDLNSGLDNETSIKDVDGFTWCADNKSYFYVHVDEGHRPNRVFLKLPHNPEPKLIYHEKDPQFHVRISSSLDGLWIIIHTGKNDQDEIRIISSLSPTSNPILIQVRQEGHEYSVHTHGNTLYIRTNSNESQNFRLVTTPVNNPGKENWKEIVPHRDTVLLDSVIIFKHYMILLEQENVLPRIRFRQFSSDRERILRFEEEAYSLRLYSGYEFDAMSLRYCYSSLSTPTQIWDINLNSDKKTLLKEQEIPSGHEPSEYLVRRLSACARDGESIPLTVLMHRDSILDGSSPCLLYGYGSYGIGVPASFSSNIISLVNRGFIYVIAHVRGGNEKGRDWYEQTKKAGKTKTFTDFLDSAHHLIKNNFTNKGKIISMGSSAGGLLVGASLNLEPDLFSGVIAQVPFVDVLNTMLDSSLPLTPTEWCQWGNPIDNKEEYSIIADYSPYENIKPTDYPAIFVLSGLTDPRVQYWESSKWVAKLRSVTTGHQPILLKTNMRSGHFGKTGRFSHLEEVALMYAFALKITGKHVN
ncbi:S9 family peptidase [Candidatus Endowatersipora endosymbiont of Watersipora subatra]|uniref:S9 family peptidase n=1 Tax=Candidatus Endowatersipora endosymbiont of Watersipora subatra TaxID=3077946 RepID=UPI00312C81A5